MRNNKYTVWVENECSHSERVYAVCTNMVAAAQVATYVSSINLSVSVQRPSRSY